MTVTKPRFNAWFLGFMILGVLLVSTLPLQGCSDLEEDAYGVITPDQFFRTEEEVIAALAPVYAQLRSLMWNYHNISQHTSDETLVPTRGTDWDDGGHWRQLHQHNWDALTVDWNGAWVDIFTGIARANVVLANLEPIDMPGKSAIQAELRFLRAFYYYLLMDLFGGVPVVTDAATDPDNSPARQSRAEVFDFVESELLTVRNDLPPNWDAANQGRVTQGAADALLAKIYLNAEVFTGTVSMTGLTRGAARWQDAIDAADRVLNSGQYTLAPSFYDNFRVDNHNSPEIIFAVGHLAQPNYGISFIMRGLHYNQIPESPWNGFSTLAETFNQFRDTDSRKNIFLVGQMFSGPNDNCIGNECFVDGEKLLDRVGNDLTFTEGYFRPDGTPVTGDPINVDERSGIRVLKWEIDPNRNSGDNGNSYAFLRLAEIYLIKAEALHRLGQTASAVSQINMLRGRVFDPDELIDAAGDFDEVLLQERLFELMWEATRRQDLIRFGKFSDTWEFKSNTDPWRILGPIPQVQIDANPNLTQNPGY